MDFMTQRAFSELRDRIDSLQAQLRKSNRPKPTLNERILFIKYTGQIDFLLKTLNTKELVYESLSYSMDADRTNIKKAITTIDTKQSVLLINDNFEKLRTVFAEKGLLEALERMENHYKLLR